jgi:diguanylate cyclase (GGDEF)-like protein
MALRRCTSSGAPRSRSTDTFLEALAKELSCVHIIVHAPSLSAEFIRPVPPAAEVTVIEPLIRQVLWPMLRASGELQILNRVRLKRDAPVVPYRILLSPLSRQDHALGMLAALRSLHQPAFVDADLKALSATAPAVHRHLGRRVDDSTGLLRRPAFEKEVTQRAQSADSACVVYANLDQIHVINELVGFRAGDHVIREVGGLWQSRLLPAGSLATHLSGDRYAAVLFGHTLNQARVWAEKARLAIEQLDFTGQQTRVTASLGVVTLPGADSFQHALAAAETACRVAKDRGRNRVEVYESGDHTVIRRHEEVRESRWLQDALESDRCVLYAQPIVALDNPLRAGHYEILLRVQDEAGRFNSIAEYLDAAERYQLLERLDRWVIAHAVKILGPLGPKLRALGASFAINLTGQSLSQPAFSEFVRAELKGAELPPGLVDFEITETAAVRNLNATRRFVARMAEIGSRVALDDFGTGLSSLVHLKELEVHRIKIDGKFVRDVLTNARSRALIRALAQIAAELGFETVAEFVETGEIAVRVQELGVRYAQGHFFGRATPLHDVLAQLQGAAGQRESSRFSPLGAQTAPASSVLPAVGPVRPASTMNPGPPGNSIPATSRV